MGYDETAYCDVLGVLDNMTEEETWSCVIFQWFKGYVFRALAKGEVVCSHANRKR